MKMKLNYLILIILLALTNCKKESNAPTIENKIYETTKILTPDDANDLVLVDSLKIVMNESNFSNGIYVGDILNSDVSVKCPYGFLRKVTGIAHNNGEVIFDTEQAALSEAVISGTFELHESLTISDVVNFDTSGLDISERDNKIIFSFPRKLIYDQDGDPSTVNDNHYVEGDFEIAPNFDYKLSILNGSIEDGAYLDFNLNLSSHLRLTHGSVGGSINKSIIITTIDLLPKSIKSPLFLVFHPYLVISLGIDGELTGSLVEQLNVGFDGSAGCTYKNSSWLSHGNADGYSNYDFVNVIGNFKANPYVAAALALRIFDQKDSRFELKVKGGVKCEGNLNALQTLVTVNVQACVNGTAKFKIGKIFLNLISVDYEADIFENCKGLLQKIYSISGCLIQRVDFTELSTGELFTSDTYQYNSNQTLSGSQGFMDIEGASLIYDSNGKLVSIAGISDSRTFIYNLMGNIEKVQYQNGEAVFIYDGNHVSTIQGAIERIELHYDANWNITQVAYTDSDGTTEVGNYEYDMNHKNPYSGMIKGLGTAWFGVILSSCDLFYYIAYSGDNMPSRILTETYFVKETNSFGYPTEIEYYQDNSPVVSKGYFYYDCN